MSGYYLLKSGEFAYNKSYSVGYDYGSIKRLDRYPMGALSTLYICFALKRHDSDFIKAYFDSLKWYREIYMISAEGARNHGLLNVPTDEFFETKHYLPENLEEQRKIADFIIALERRIEAQQSLVDNLKKYKRGVSKCLFDSNCSYPKSSPLWSKVRINDIASIFIGEFVIKTKQSSSAPYPVYNGGTSFTGLYDDYNQEGNRVLVSARGANAGFVNKMNGKCWIGNSCYAISLSENAPIFFDYLYHYLKFNQGKLIESQQSANIPSISKKQLQDFIVEFPDLNTQQEIVQLLNYLDAKINYEERKIAAFGSLKLGLLQQLFI